MCICKEVFCNYLGSEVIKILLWKLTSFDLSLFFRRPSSGEKALWILWLQWRMEREREEVMVELQRRHCLLVKLKL
ncbi:hypothetical protein SLE2022_028300 [Rubroshorea leprosula]